MAADTVTSIGEFEFPSIVTIYPKVIEAEKEAEMRAAALNYFCSQFTNNGRILDKDGETCGAVVAGRRLAEEEPTYYTDGRPSINLYLMGNRFAKE